MIFARYTGKSDNLTRGRVYLARPEIDDGETVGLDLLTIKDDKDQQVKIHPDDEGWEYLEEVYAVVVKDNCDEDWEAGEVVVISDAVDDGSADPLLRVKGVGLYRGSNFVLLDRTNVYPGLVVMESYTGRWVTIRRVDECLWFMANGCEFYRSPEEFRFAVSGNDILTEPLVKCVDAAGESLTEGHLYRLIKTGSDFVVLKDDCEAEREFMASRFKFI